MQYLEMCILFLSKTICSALQINCSIVEENTDEADVRNSRLMACISRCDNKLLDKREGLAVILMLA